jgi:hypothetical protein
MKPIPPGRLAAAVEVGAKIFAVLHLIAIPIILSWSCSEEQSAYQDSILEAQAKYFGTPRSYKHEPPEGVTFLMQLYIALSGALFWSAVAAALGLARADEEPVNSAGRSKDTTDGFGEPARHNP